MICDLYLLLIKISLQSSSGWITSYPLLFFYYNYFTISSAHFCKIGNFLMILFKYLCWIFLYFITLIQSLYNYWSLFVPSNSIGSSPKSIISSNVPKFLTTFLHILACINLSSSYIYFLDPSSYFFSPSPIFLSFKLFFLELLFFLFYSNSFL